MVEESFPFLPPAEKGIEGETEIALDREPHWHESIGEPTSEPDFVCECDESTRSACRGLPFYKQHESRGYCVLHFPGEEKSADFKAALDRKLNEKDFDFRGVWFPDRVIFQYVRFNGKADFFNAYFNAQANFSSAKFKKIDFREARFKEVYFSHATFNADVHFGNATFTTAHFDHTTFKGPVCFSTVQFSEKADFSESSFNSLGDFIDASFPKGARFEKVAFNNKAEFEHVTFGKDGEEANFREAHFTEEVNFRWAIFEEQANFSYATFGKDADFRNATFKEANFRRTTFGAKAGFSYRTFSGKADFRYAEFNSEAYFLGTSFSALTDFSHAKFGDWARFHGPVFSNQTSLDLQYARIEKPARFSFHSVGLRPHWFVNVDARNFDFTNVEWPGNINEQIESLRVKEVAPRYRLLAITCRQLAVNAEENHRYEEASKFRYWSMDVRRQEKWRGCGFWKLYWWYWAASGYGERSFRAFAGLILTFVSFAFFYTQIGFAQQSSTPATETAPPMMIEDHTGQPLEMPRAFTYSLAVMSLQKPEPTPLTNWAHTLVTLETILGPVQAALLALAIRRKFMR